MNDDRHTTTPPVTPYGFPSSITVTVNVVVSGGLVVEFKSTTADGITPEQLAILTARIKASGNKVDAVVNANPPTPINP